MSRTFADVRGRVGNSPTHQFLQLRSTARVLGALRCHGRRFVAELTVLCLERLEACRELLLVLDAVLLDYNAPG